MNNITPPTCLVCGSTNAELWSQAHDIEYFTTNEIFSYFRCRCCGNLYIDPVPHDRLEEIYPTNYYSYAGQGNSLVTRIKDFLDKKFFATLLCQLNEKTLSVLDVGGGDGHQLSTLRAMDSRISFSQVVDLDDGAQIAAKAKGHAFHLGPIETFKTERRFDLILLLNVIEHVADPRSVLTRMRELLAPGGLLVVKTPNIDALDARLFRHTSWAGYHCPRHWVLFSDSTFPTLARQVGLEVRTLKLTQGAPFWAASIVGWLGKKGVVRIDSNHPTPLHPLTRLLQVAFAAFDIIRAPLGKTSQMFCVLERNVETR